MSIKTIKNGILKQDWDLVVRGYNDITGEDLTLDTTLNDPPIKNKNKKVKKKNTTKTKNRSVKVSVNKNKDGMVFFTDPTEPPTPANLIPKRDRIVRPRFDEIKIKCDGCSADMLPYQISKTRADEGKTLKYCNKCSRK